MLYSRIFTALKPNGVFINGDLVAANLRDEQQFCEKKRRLMIETGFKGGMFHYDTPLARETEMRLLLDCGFDNREIVKQ